MIIPEENFHYTGCLPERARNRGLKEEEEGRKKKRRERGRELRK